MKRNEVRKRVRRDPDEARALILDGAERVFGDKGPDAAGLKDVARAVGVSHALVSHYFGSYEALVEETLARRITRARDAIVGAILAGDDDAPASILDRVAAVAEDRLTVRLLGWAFLSGRAGRADFFSARERGLKLVVDALEARRAAQGEPKVPREAIELAVISALTMTIGFGIAKEGLLAGLGHPPSSPEAKRFPEKYAEFVRAVTLGHLTSISHKSARR